MRDHDQKYYLVKSGEVKKRAEEHREKYLRLHRELWAVIKTFGVEKASICNTMMRIRGLCFEGEPPAGWTKPKHGISYPKRGVQAMQPELRKFFTPSGCYTVEMHPELKPFYEWLGCPRYYGWKAKDGKSSGGSVIGRLFSDSCVFWYDAKGPIMLELPDVAAAKKYAAEKGYIVENNVLDWVPPKGLKEILLEEWKLMEAKYERAQKAKAG